MNRLGIIAFGILLLLAPTSQSLAAENGTTGSGRMNDVQIKQKLEAEGYTNVRIKEHEKKHVDVTATKHGKSQRLAVDPKTGQIAPHPEADDD